MPKPSSPYYGLSETTYAGTSQLGERSSPARIELVFEDAHHAHLEVAAGAARFRIRFTWTWFEDKKEATIGVKHVEVAGRTVAGKSVGKIVGDHLDLTITLAEPIELDGATGQTVRIDARQAT
jgi:hypothetical protein